MKKLNILELNRMALADYREADKIPFVVVLDNVRSLHNVGSVFRTSDAYRVERILLCGVTATPPSAEIHKTALGAEDMLDIYSSGDITNDLKDLKKQGWQVVGLENNIEKVPIFALNNPELKGKMSDKVVLVLGEEVKGIDYSLYDIIDLFVEIPMKGKKESFNVSVAAGIATYGIMNL